ncbi:MAG TPA: CHAT domain-containing protein [Pyrinomonadaceae bacterium]|jgi:CHAT domain-containing protein
MRNGELKGKAFGFHSAFRIPHSSFLFSLFLCSLLSVAAPAQIAGSASLKHLRRQASPASPSVAQIGGAIEGGAALELREGKLLLRRGRAGDALVRLENALGLYKVAGNREGEAAAHDLLGELYERQGRYDLALEHFQSAYKIFADLNAKSSRQTALAAAVEAGAGSYNANLMQAKIGNMFYRQGRINEARSAYGRMQVSRPNTNALTVAQGAQSKVNRARSLKDRLRGLATGRPSTSTGSQATGIATDTVKIVTSPLETYRQSIIYATYELGMGRVDFFNGQLDSARKHFENTLTATLADIPVVGKLGQMRRYRTAARTSLADIASTQGQFAEALRLYGEAARGAQADERLDLMWPAQSGIARTLWAQSEWEQDAAKRTRLREQSIAAYRDALRSIETLREGSVRADEARTTFLATTKSVFDDASAALAEMALSGVATPPPATATTATTANTSAPAVLEGKSLEYAGEALRIVEEGRARSLLDMLGEAGARITEGVPAELLKRKQENLEQQEELAAQLTGVQLATDATAKAPDALESDLSRLESELDSIENQIRAASPRYGALTRTSPLALADIQRTVLDERTALVEYSLGLNRSYLWTVTQTGVALFRLPARTTIERQAVELRDQIVPKQLRRTLTTAADPQRGLALSTTPSQPSTPAQQSQQATAFAVAAHALYKTIFEPAAAHVGERRLLVVADGALNYVPFEALVTSPPAASGADYTTLSYLIKKHEVVYAPSASVIAAVRQQSSAGASKSARDVLLVADPVFDATDPRASNAQPRASAKTKAANSTTPSINTTTTKDSTRGLALSSALADVTADSPAPATNSASSSVRLARLEGTRDEAQKIAQLGGKAGRKVDLWLDLEASEENIESRDLSSYRILHIATHGLVNTERPQFTGVVLSLVGRGEGDGFVRTGEIFNLRLGSPLVMLSACETGLGRERRGEGVIGLTRAFMYAGAPTVGVSLWSVADRSTADLMTDFYSRLLLKEGTSPVAAMRAARQSMIANRKYSAPFFWAPFVLVGDWR